MATEQPIERYIDLCRWLTEIFPTIRICEDVVQVAPVTHELIWGKIYVNGWGSIIIYGVKKEFWETAVAPRIRETYPEIVVVDGFCERKILTLELRGEGPLELRLWPVLYWALKEQTILWGCRISAQPPQE
jgi:hypothetical protein